MKRVGYLLDSETTLFRAVEFPAGNSYKPLYDLISCQMIEVVRLDERHSLFVDEEGLGDGLSAFTIFEGYPQPLAGKIVLVGGDGSELYASPLISRQRPISSAAARYWTPCLRPETK
ncbi:DUF3846 domain-containing protein [Mesorhizobium sp. M0199]